MRQAKLIVLVSLFFVFLIFVKLDDSRKQSYTEFLQKNLQQEVLLEYQINSSFPITFYHNAYVDHRTNPPRLRIYSLNWCIKKSDFLLVELFYEGVRTEEKIKVYGGSLEGPCPSGYGPAKPCFYVAHTFAVIHLGEHRKINLSVKEIHNPTDKGITLCLQPVYYYSQWQNIVLYVEAWRAQGATRFIVFYHSATKQTRRVLEHYQSLGLIEFRSWPSFGSLPSKIAGRYPRIDDSTFIFSYYLAMNICILDIKTTFGSVADFDEVMVPRNGTMLDYATREMSGTNVGALSFANNYVSMDPSIYTSDFSGLTNLSFYAKGGPSKYIFDASVIDVCQVHWVRSFTNKTKKTKRGDGAVLHLRFNAKNLEKKVSKPFQFFPDNTETHIKNIDEDVKTIFGESPPVESLEFVNVLNKCVGEKTKGGGKCRSTGGMCKADMDAVYDWVYDKTEGIFLSGEN
ncbi:hypothetical protein CRE_12973 [Caenorhabditis remanei]|uniref:Glycosyltransferase family 92 protein n=1 Tax=Caenorhabditis remanei TaxID=31234 RepID=E3N123_CAERE|nr:hypothetical protein CRE_12973 [Caenorhabditis remanei]